MNFTIIDADAHHLDGPAYKDYLPEKYRERSGPYARSTKPGRREELVVPNEKASQDER